MYIDTGSTVNLTCIVHGLNEPPTSILWTHNGYVSFISSLPSTFSLLLTAILIHLHSIFRLSKEINYDSPRGGVSVITEKSDITTSYLLIQRAKPADSGKYICRWKYCFSYQPSDLLKYFSIYISAIALHMQIQRASSFTFWIVSIVFCLWTVCIKTQSEHLLCRRCSQNVWTTFYSRLSTVKTRRITCVSSFVYSMVCRQGTHT